MEQGLVSVMGAEPNDGFRRVLVSSETEIKFAVEKGRKTKWVGEETLRPSNYETLYFDTDNFELRRHRAELCVRKRDGQVHPEDQDAPGQRQPHRMPVARDCPERS